MKFGYKGGVVLGTVLYARADEFKILPCVFIGRVEFEGSLVANYSFAEIVTAEVSVAEVVPCR